MAGVGERLHALPDPGSRDRRRLAPALVIFDLAGTTVADNGEVPAAFLAALSAHGLDVDAGRVENVRGASKREAVARFVPPGPDHESRCEAVYRRFRADLASRYEASVTEIGGATALFAALRRRGIRVALNTGFDREITTLLTGALGWSTGAVDAIVCGDDVRAGRPAPDLIRAAMAAVQVDDPGTVANVGDTALDLRAAHAAGTGWNIGVLSGAHDRNRLSAEPHTHLIASIAELLHTIDPP